MKNENGGALLIVLLTITLLSIFSLGLLYQVQSSSKQFTKTEKQVQSTNVAEMGLQHVRELVAMNRTYFPVSVAATRNELRNKILTSSIIQNLEPSSSNAQYSVSIDYQSIQGNYFEIDVESTGEVKDESETFEETLRFTLTGGWQYLEDLDPFDTLDGYNQNTEDQFKKNAKASTCVSSDRTNIDTLVASVSSQYFIAKNNKNNGQGNSNGNSGQGKSKGTEYECQSNQQFVSDKFVQVMQNVKLTINGNLVLRNGLQMKNDSLLVVNGDFHSGNDLSRKNVSGNKGTIIVNGHAYLPEENLGMNHPKICITGSTNYPIEKQRGIESCNPEILKLKPYGVYVSGELSDGMNWRIETME
ncbi:hypothetical protein N780_02795 [Pontibacillus chungwhensis BH030062]|uniref:Type 4 fimbrial biogenesis protein PilX N-terminal domain-containing protein n=1 Tax=Pontibacillus chungwhensis BH030062 TaxID=1385513 RepID=A0A0A2UW49_9BACI|nr:hypothetical protein [Pontibacillus chungwhensis]KGP90963.1 hypothetical protein N780_02795 [Pontibacillus chungwhensis BH030062]